MFRRLILSLDARTVASIPCRCSAASRSAHAAVSSSPSPVTAGVCFPARRAASPASTAAIAARAAYRPAAGAAQGPGTSRKARHAGPARWRRAPQGAVPAT